ncbi:hypothetical protein C8R42DRAFT_653775 [Lentinula raphanica]|nr:hypothetical protein C8R42DRAFT_653775 [Lentinula raphanica]
MDLQPDCDDLNNEGLLKLVEARPYPSIRIVLVKITVKRRNEAGQSCTCRDRIQMKVLR